MSLGPGCTRLGPGSCKEETMEWEWEMMMGELNLYLKKTKQNCQLQYGEYITEKAQWMRIKAKTE